MSENPPSGWQPTGNAKADAKVAKAYAKAQRPWFKKKRFLIPIALVVLIAIIAVTSGGDEPSSDSEGKSSSESSQSNTDDSKSKKTEKKQKVVKVKAKTLLDTFEKNELEGDEKYKGKRLQISGVVAKIDTDFWDKDKYILQIGSGDEWEFLFVNCHGIPKGELSKLAVGDDVTVVGDFDDGGSLGVEVKKCSVV